MRIVFISDTHGYHKTIEDNLKKIGGDVLIHSGDSECYDKKSTTDFIHWIMGLKEFDTKIFIAGNHDFSFEKNMKGSIKKEMWFTNLINDENLSQSDVYYLEDSEMSILFPNFSRPIKFYGSPWQPTFRNWAFNLPRNGSEIEEKWNNIPLDTDILITHGPPFGIRDKVGIRGNVYPMGCEILKNKIDLFSPIIHCFGHIHLESGVTQKDGVTYVNSSICNDYVTIPTFPPIVLDIEENNGKISVIKYSEY
jgi:Icc-related predicted phosphoesterase